MPGAPSSFPLPLGGEGRVRGAAGATSSLWVRPPLLDPLPRRGRGIRKRGFPTRLPAAMQRPGAREGLRDPGRGARSSFPLPLGGEGRVRGAAGATSSLWVRPPSPFDSACTVRPPLLDPLPRWGRGIRKRGCATRLPAAMQRPGAREGLRDPGRGADRRAALLALEAASQVAGDRGCHSERSLRSEESTRSDLPAASAQAGGFATPLKDKSLRVDPSLRSG